MGQNGSVQVSREREENGELIFKVGLPLIKWAWLYIGHYEDIRDVISSNMSIITTTQFKGGYLYFKDEVIEP